MSATAMTKVPWWKEPTKDQWHAWIAAWLGWTLEFVRLHGVPVDHGADRQKTRLRRNVSARPRFCKPTNGQHPCGGNDEIGRLELAGRAGIRMGLDGHCTIPLFDRKRPPGSARPPCGASRKHGARDQLGLVDLHPVTGRNPMKGGVAQMGPKILRHADIEVRIVLAPD